MVLPAGVFGGLDDVFRYHGGIGLCDFPFFEFAGDDLFDLVFQAEGDAGDVFGRHGGFDEVAGILREDYGYRLALVI